ncbi:hypothetical protein BV497_07220 [Fulvimonas soli]|uniref:VOC family protein n=1 Tax=Fulvimonas soli TaxID=155197 RepID=A0A316IHS7_9GAMM|nr:hypothetical protein C7456_101415 [Fulvimonas soli]TNY26719.1 hypothetical protein BV497_07220 [Fulvimonas soli]
MEMPVPRSAPSLLLALLLAVGLPAARAGDADDYARISVPDVAQAARFFRDTLGCEPLGPASGDGALLACARGEVVELAAGAADAAPVRLRGNDVAAVAAWLRRRQVPLLDAAAAHAAGRAELRLRAPWGQTLVLVGADATPPGDDAARLAAQ